MPKKIIMENKPRLALDLDNTTFDMGGAILKQLGTKYTNKDLVSYGWIQEKYGEARFWKAYYYVWENGLVGLIEQDSPEVIKKLSEIYDISYVTKRKEVLREPTEKELKHYKFPELPLVLVPMGGDKLKLDFDVYVDDHPDLVEQVKDTDKILYLYDMPYNRNIELNDNTTRIYSLKDLLP